MLAPEAIFLTGGVAKAGHLLLDAAKNALGGSLPPQCDVDLRLSEMNDDFAAARGAAALCMKNYCDKARF
jgi:predicted NBD/HSP70 family sugar kinase